MNKAGRCRLCGCDEGPMVHYNGCPLWPKIKIAEVKQFIKFIPKPGGKSDAQNTC